MATGANTTPLGRMSHSGPSINIPKQLPGLSSGSSLLKPSYMSGKRDLDSLGGDEYRSSNWPLDYGAQDRKKKRRSRWGGDDKDKVFIPGMPTVLPNNLSANQEKAYLLQLQIEEISRRLRTGDLGIPLNPEERSPSPEPIYNSEGKRLNTREYRTRKKLEDDRHTHIQEMFKVNPEYKPPADYKPPMVRVCEKVMIPQDEHPDINFVGLLIGPRGNTLKSMEKETGAKIIIRGKGSVKEGKVGRKDGQPLPGEDEPLHAFVTATNPDAVKKAVDKIKEIIRQGVEVPEGQNDLRRMQLRELALLNGTLRENEGPRCTNCGAANHRSWQCPDKPNVTNNVICSNCGGAGHIARDCREKKAAASMFGTVEKSKIDEEYMSLMAELGEGPPPPAKTSTSAHSVPFMAPNPLAGPQGPIRAIMAPPPSTNMSAVPPPWLNSTSTAGSAAASNQTNKPGVMTAGGMLLPPPGMMNLPPPPTGVPPPPGTSAPPPQVPLVPWQQQPPPQAMSNMAMQGVPPPPGMMGQPPLPPGSQQSTPSVPWMAMTQPPMPPGMTMQMPWQQQQQGPPPVPPPPGQQNPVQTGTSTGAYPWMGFVGVPPPPPVQPPLPPGLAVPPPPPPPPLPTTTATSTSSGGVDLTAVISQGLPNLLAAPPPPPPPPS